MDKPTYTEIPDTSDTNYWIKTQHEKDRSSTFVPRDKELHHELKEKAWKLLQAKNPRKNLNNNKYKGKASRNNIIEMMGR